MDRSRLLSCIVPVRNDAARLRRLVQYFSEVRFPWWIVIADASDSDQQRQNQQWIARYGRDLNIGWIAAPGSEFDQCRTALLRISTPFSTVCQPENFVLPELLGRAIGFLQREPGFSMALGITVSHLVARGGRCYALPGRSIGNDSPVVRARKVTTRGISLRHGVQRTEHLRKSFELASRCLTDAAPDRMIDLLLSQLAALHGRIRFFPVVGCIRCEPAPEAGPVRRSAGSPPPNLDVLQEILINELEAAGATLDHAHELVRRWYARYLTGAGQTPVPMTLPRKARRELVRHVCRLIDLVRSDRILQHRRIRRSDLRGQESAWKIAQRLIAEWPSGVDPELPGEAIRRAA